MDNWMLILNAVFIVMILVFLYPRLKQVQKNTRKASSQEWLNFAAIMAVVVLFVVFLIMLVRG